MKNPKASKSLDNDKLVFYWFLRQRQILEKGLSKYSPKNRLTGLVNKPLVESIVDSCISLEPLRDGGKIRDCLAIGRCICETAINVSYIEAEGEAAAERMLRYAAQREYRDLNRKLTVGETIFGLQYTGKVEAPENLKQALAEFTNKKNGREITTWCEKPIHGRLERIGEVFGEKVMRQISVPYFSIYRTASEVLHGTLYGIMNIFGAKLKPEERTDHQRTNFTMLFFMLGNVLSGMSETLISNKTFPPMIAEIRAVKQLMKQMDFEAGD